MALGTKDRPERIASELSSKAVKGPGANTGASGTDPEAKSAGISMKLKIIIAVVLLVAVGATVKFTLLAPAKAANAATAKPQPGPVVQLSEMTLNLTGGQYLRVKLSLQTIKGSKPITDTDAATQAVIDVFSNRTPAELTGDAARTKAKRALLATLQKDYPKQVMDATYTEFVMTS